MILKPAHKCLSTPAFPRWSPFSVGWIEALTFKESTVEEVMVCDCRDKVIKDRRLPPSCLLDHPLWWKPATVLLGRSCDSVETPTWQGTEAFCQHSAPMGASHFGRGPSNPVQPLDSYNAGWWLGGRLLRDPKLDPPNQAASGHLIHRECNNKCVLLFQMLSAELCVTYQ